MEQIYLVCVYYSKTKEQRVLFAERTYMRALSSVLMLAPNRWKDEPIIGKKWYFVKPVELY